MRLLIAALIASMFCGTIAAQASPYDDVPIEHWAYDSLEYLTESGVLVGYPDGFFKGDRTLTRYEFAQAIAKLLDASDFDNEDIRILAETLRAEFSDQLAELNRGLEDTAAHINGLDARIGDLEGAAGENDARIGDLESRVNNFSSGPNWWGEFRYRWDFQRKQTRVSQPNFQRFRQRIRLRLGYSKQIHDAVEMNFRLQTGTGIIATDSNHTLGNNGRTSDIFLDQAYVKYTPSWFGFYTRCEEPVDCDGCSTCGCPVCTDCIPKLDIYAGMFPNISMDPNEMVLDDDVNLQGAGLVYHFNQDFQILTAASVVVETNGFDYDDDTYMFVTELRHANLFTDGLDAWVGAYGWNNEAGLPDAYFTGNQLTNFDFNNDGNINGSDRFTNNFHTVKAGLNYTFDCEWDKPLSVYGEYMQNIDADADDRIAAVNPFINPDIVYNDSDDMGWVAGIQYGQVPQYCSDWYAFARYKEIGANAIIDGLGDQDAGGANVNSFEIHWMYMWSDDSLVGITYFNNTMNNAFGFPVPNGATDECLTQIDWIFRF